MILNRHKIHGRKERFSREFAINPKKLRISRYSEHIPRKCLQLQIDEDVQPQITTLRESGVFLQRNRTESCFPRIQHQRPSNLEIPGPSMPSIDSRLEEIYENRSSLRVLNEKFEKDEGFSDENSNEIHRIIKGFPIELDSYDKCPFEYIEKSTKSFVEEISIIEEIKPVNLSCFAEIHPEPYKEYNINKEMNYSRNCESVSVSIDGKIFGYFDKTQLCSIPVYNFSNFVLRIRSFEVKIDNA